MKVKIGDLVRFVDEAIEGHVTSFQGEEIIGVTDSSGFEIPVAISKVTLVHGNMHRADDDEDILPAVAGPFVGEGIYLAVTGDQNGGLATFHLVNETSYRLLVSVANKSGKNSKGIAALTIGPNDITEFYKANFSAVGKWPIFQIQVLRYTEESHTATEPISKEIQVKPVGLNSPKTKNELLDEKAWLFQLDKEEENIGLEKLKGFGGRL